MSSGAVRGTAVGNGDEVTYHWRRENLVLGAHMQCFGACPADFAAARAWAEAIDARARSD